MASSVRGGKIRTVPGSSSVKGVFVESAREKSLSVLSSGVGRVERAVDPRSRCWSKERHSESHRIGGEAWAPGRGTDPAVVESSWAVVGSSWAVVESSWAVVAPVVAPVVAQVVAMRLSLSLFYRK